MVALANFNLIWFLHGVRFLLGTLALCLAAPMSATAGPKQLRTPPVGETIDAQVMRGGSIRITLKAFEGRGNPLAYKIASSPRHGELDDFRQADNDRQGFASVVYAHGDDEDSREDEFSFRAEALVGGGVSSPIKVRVRIVDAAPKLQVTPVVNFSTVAGETERQQIILANEGGGLLEGSIAPKEPFSVEGNPRFSLGRGDMTNIVIRFSPRTVDTVAPQRISPAPADPATTVTLRGEALAPFQASAEPLRVQPDGSREGTIAATNFSYAPIVLEIALAPDDATEIASQAEIPGQGIAEIPLRIGPEKADGAREIRVALSNAFHQQDLTIQVPAVPPRLELATPELDFRNGNEAILTVKNSGGTEGRVTLELDSTGKIKPIEGAQNFVVAPGKTREIRLRSEKRQENQNPDFLMVQLGREGKVPVPLLFIATQPSPSPTQLKTAPMPSPTPSAMPWELNRDVKLEVSAGEVFVVWKRAKEGTSDALLETVDGEVSAPYREESAKPEGWWDAIMSWWTDGTQKANEALEDKKQFFDDRLKLPGEKEPEKSNPPESGEDAWLRVAVRGDDAQEDVRVWRVTAREESNAARKPVSPNFKIDWQGQTLVPAEPKAADRKSDAQPGDEAVTPGPPQSSQPPIAPTMVEPARKIKGDVISERTRATVRLAIDEDREIDGFRLERGEMVAALDAKTGIPTRTEFVPLAHAGKVTISAPAAAEHEGKKLTMVVATIEGLQPGTATFWRLLPLSGDKELMPTEQFIVMTSPPWQFPWRPFFLGLLTALLAAVLWLRHKSREAERQ
jgi:hypothetical protein